jgi:hypothetical protein
VASQTRQGIRSIDRGPRNIARGKRPGGPTLAGRTPGNRNIVNGSPRRPALTEGRNAALQKSVLRNRALANASNRDRSAWALAHKTFRGKLAEHGKGLGHPHWAWKHDRKHRFHRHIFVIGWIGPLFWPYAYDDFIDYTFWPYAYDTFWPYAYDDVYVSVFGPYAYDSGAYANVAVYREGRRAPVRVPRSGVAQVCSVEAAGLTDWPIEQIAQAVEPNETQQPLLASLKDATANAVELMQSACPNDLPATPVGRLAAMRTRLETMVRALSVVKPALDRFYDSLSDEQKARFNALGDRPAPRSARASGRQDTDLAQACSQQATGSLPIDRVRQAVRPTPEQAAALDALNDASRQAAEQLRGNCEGDQSLTPTGRVAAMERRLNAMLTALDIVQPALERFYGSLSDEQKARFNQLGTRQARQS